MTLDFARRLAPVSILAIVLVACGGPGGEEGAGEEPAPDAVGTEEAAMETPADRGGTWYEVSGASSVSAPEPDAFFSFEEFSGTWMLLLSADDKGTVAIRFPDGFEPAPGEYPIAFTTDEGVIATFDQWDGPTFSYDQSGTLEITGADGTFSATFSYTASTDEGRTVDVEGAVTEEIGEAFGPPPSG